jgi:hypothetical protein
MSRAFQHDCCYCYGMQVLEKCGGIVENVIKVDFRKKPSENTDELIALANMLTFAKETASEHEVPLAAYLIDMAIAALRDDVAVNGRI